MTAKKTAEEKVASSAENILSFKNLESVETIMANSKEKFEKFTSGTAELGQENLDAVMKASTTFTKGFEGLFKSYTTLVQEAAERNAAAYKSLLGSKTINEYAEAQAELAQQNLDDFLGGATRLSEQAVKLATETLEPLTAQATKTWNKACKAAA